MHATASPRFTRPIHEAPCSTRTDFATGWSRCSGTDEELETATERSYKYAGVLFVYIVLS